MSDLKRITFKLIYNCNLGSLKNSVASFLVEKLTAHELALFRDRRIKDGIRTCQYDLVLIRHILEIARKEWNLGLAVNPVDQIRDTIARLPQGVGSVRSEHLT